MWVIGMILFAYGFIMLFPVQSEEIKIERVLEIITFLGLYLMLFAISGKCEMI
jgi:uncharacterized membrane protein